MKCDKKLANRSFTIGKSQLDDFSIFCYIFLNQQNCKEELLNTHKQQLLYIILQEELAIWLRTKVGTESLKVKEEAKHFRIEIGIFLKQGASSILS